MLQFVKRSFVLLLAVVLIGSLLSACGPSVADYQNKVMTSMDTYSKSFETAMNTLTAAQNPDEMKSQEYKDKVATALSAWEAAGKELGSISASDVPADYKDFNDVLVKISEQTSVSAKEVNDALAADDINQLQTAVNNMQKIVDLLDEASQKAPQ